MESDSSQVRIVKHARQRLAGKWVTAAQRRRIGLRAAIRGDETVEPEATSERMDAVQPHPLAELLDCPPMIGSLLNASTTCVDYDTGDVVFRQSSSCRGLFVIVLGQFLRKAERIETRLTLGPARPGDLVELAAALGDGRHTYTLTAQTPGSVLMLPIEGLLEAFQSYPRLRMQLLEELAREVSRAYNSCGLRRAVRSGRRATESKNA